MRFYDAFGVPEKSVFTRLFRVFATAMLANFQDFCNVSVLPIFQGIWLTLNYDKNPAFTRLFAVFDRRGIRTAFIFRISTIVELYRCL